MLTQEDAEKDSASVLKPHPCSKAPWRVEKVDVVAERTLRVTFVDGMSGLVRFEPSFFSGVFDVLKDSMVFNKVHVEYGAVTWPGEIDLAPDAMHNEIKAKGEWVLQ